MDKSEEIDDGVIDEPQGEMQASVKRLAMFSDHYKCCPFQHDGGEMEGEIDNWITFKENRKYILETDLWRGLQVSGRM